MDQQPAQPPSAMPPEGSAPSAPAPSDPPPAPPAESGAWDAPAEPSGPAPGLQFGGYGGRLVAYIIDTILVSVIGMALAIVLGVIGIIFAAGGFEAIAGSIFIFLFIAVFAVSLGYFPWFWVRSGQTPGMRLFRLRVVRDRDGGPISWGSAILRLIGYWINGVVLYIGFIWVFVDSRRRGWHDLIAGTVVVQEEP